MKLHEAQGLNVGDFVSKAQTANPYSTSTWAGTITHKPDEKKVYVDGSLVFQLAIDIRRHQTNAQRKGQSLKGTAGYYIDVQIGSTITRQSIGFVKLDRKAQEVKAA